MDTHRAFERFVQKVELAGECWLWTGCKPIPGHQYGQFRDEYMRRLQAHRFSYEFFVGPIPKDLQLDHLCRNEACVNPRHLEPVTAQENALRGIRVIPCVHGKRARSHCVICAKENAKDVARVRMRQVRGSTRINEHTSEPSITVGFLLGNSVVAAMDARVDRDGTSRSSIMRKALTLYLCAAPIKDAVNS